MNADFYNEDYYINGPQTGKSNYSNYGWKPDLTLPMVDWLKRCLGIKGGETLLDVGCARGYLVKAMRMRGVIAFGYDHSKWAVENADDEIKMCVSNTLQAEPLSWDYVVMKDVAEHIPLNELEPLLQRLVCSIRKSFLMIVPLTFYPNGPYLRDEDNSDSSHVIAWPLDAWMDLLNKVVPPNEGIVSASWHYPGLKPASEKVHKSCGFIRFQRI